MNWMEILGISTTSYLAADFAVAQHCYEQARSLEQRPEQLRDSTTAVNNALAYERVRPIGPISYLAKKKWDKANRRALAVRSRLEEIAKP